MNINYKQKAELLSTKQTPLEVHEKLQEFKSDMEANGLLIGDIIGDGEIHRCRTADKPQRQNGWYIAHADHPVSGAYGNWRTGETWNYSAKNDHKLTPEESDRLKALMESDKKKRQEEKARLHSEAKQKAKTILAASKPATSDHPYLVAKGVTPVRGIRIAKDGRLLIPVVSIKEGVVSLQFIAGDGEKRFLAGGQMQGCCFSIPASDGIDNENLYICEGYATGVSINMASGGGVLVAFSAGNLVPVARIVREKYPKLSIVICADNDHATKGNPGLTKATEAAGKIGALLAVPSFKDPEGKSDFNDLMQAEGIEKVKSILEAAQQVTIQDNQQDTASISCELSAKKLTHLELAREVVQSYGDENIIYCRGSFWIWGSGVWYSVDDMCIKQRIHAQCECYIKTSSTVESILKMVKTEASKDSTILDPANNFINCLNGELHWKNDEWVLKEHNKLNYSVSQIPVQYNPEAIAPRFEQFLEEIFETDEDKEDKKVIVCELLGYSLLASTKFETFAMLIGAGANGKSVLLNIVEALVGSENCSAVQPSQFDNKFQRAHLQGKLVNIVTEIAEGAEIADAALKAISSGERTTVEQKMKNPFDIHPYVLCWFATNHMPRTRDFSSALFRRAVILTFNHVFKEHEQDRHLIEKLKQELPGILNLALAGISAALKRGELTKAASSIESSEEWRYETDQVALFAQDRCTFSEDAITKSSDLYDVYKSWAEEEGVKRTVNKNTLTRRMINLGASKCRGHKGTRCLSGVRLL